MLHSQSLTYWNNNRVSQQFAIFYEIFTLQGKFESSETKIQLITFVSAAWFIFLKKKKKKGEKKKE